MVGWLIKIDVQTRVDINKKVNEDIEFRVNIVDIF